MLMKIFFYRFSMYLCGAYYLINGPVNPVIIQGKYLLVFEMGRDRW